MQHHIAELFAAIERTLAFEEEGCLDSWRAIEACQGEVKTVTKTLRTLIAHETDAEASQWYQGMLASAKRLHHSLVRAKADAIARTAQDN